MQFSAYVLLSIIFYDPVLSEFQSTRKLKLKMPNYKISTDQDLAFSGFLLVPILIASSVKQKQNVENGIKIKENYKDNGVGDINNSIMNSEIQEENSAEENFRQAVDRINDKRRDLSQLKANSTMDNLGNLTTDRNTEEDNEITTLEVTTSEPIITEKITTEFYTTTGFQGIYPDAYYNNSKINSLELTIESPSLVLSPPSDKQWKNFTLNTNVSIFKENTTGPAFSDSWNNTRNPSVNETVSSIKGVYPAALYNNVEIDQLSITTNSYTNELPLPPTQDDRWNNFSSLTKRLQTSNEFRPLAGLYYDGFLQRPLVKVSDFMPYNR